MIARKTSKKIRVKYRLITISKYFMIIFSIIFAGFCGGFFSPFAFGWSHANQFSNNGDAISVVNTFIVFVTLIFIAVTVLVTIAAYIFSNQIVHSKISMQIDFIDEIVENLNDDGKLAIDLINEILQNTDVTEHIESLMRGKIFELINSCKNDLENTESDLSSISGELK